MLLSVRKILHLWKMCFQPVFSVCVCRREGVCYPLLTLQNRSRCRETSLLSCLMHLIRSFCQPQMHVYLKKIWTKGKKEKLKDKKGVIEEATRRHFRTMIQADDGNGRAFEVCTSGSDGRRWLGCIHSGHSFRARGGLKKSVLHFKDGCKAGQP